MSEIHNYCHDPIIVEIARRLGIDVNNPDSADLINSALSLGEATAYDGGVDAAAEKILAYLDARARLKANRSPKTGLSDNQKEEIRRRLSR